MITRINSVTRITKEMQNYTGEKSILAVFEEILLKSCLEHSKNKTKMTEGRKKNPPVAGQGLRWSQNSCRIEFSSKNGWEISSSVYGMTRWPQLYIAIFPNDAIYCIRDISRYKTLILAAEHRVKLPEVIAGKLHHHQRFAQHNGLPGMFTINSWLLQGSSTRPKSAASGPFSTLAV